MVDWTYVCWSHDYRHTVYWFAWCLGKICIKCVLQTSASWWRYNRPIFKISGRGSLLAFKEYLYTVSKQSDQWYRRLAVHRQTDTRTVDVDANGRGLYGEVRHHPRNPGKKDFLIYELGFKSYRAKHKVASWWRYNSPIWKIWGRGSLLASKKCVCTVSKQSDQWYRRLGVHRQTDTRADGRIAR